MTIEIKKVEVFIDSRGSSHSTFRGAAAADIAQMLFESGTEFTEDTELQREAADHFASKVVSLHDEIADLLLQVL